MGFVDTNPAALRALRQTIAAVWPEVLLPSEGYEHAGGILEQTQIKREAYESLGYPRAQIELPPAAVWAHSPMTMVVYEQPALVYYVGTTESGDSVPFRSKVKLLQDRLLDPVFGLVDGATATVFRSEEHTSELQSHSFISYAVFCLK